MLCGSISTVPKEGMCTLGVNNTGHDEAELNDRALYPFPYREMLVSPFLAPRRA